MPHDLAWRDSKREKRRRNNYEGLYKSEKWVRKRQGMTHICDAVFSISDHISQEIKVLEQTLGGKDSLVKVSWIWRWEQYITESGDVLPYPASINYSLPFLWIMRGIWFDVSVF